MVSEWVGIVVGALSLAVAGLLAWIWQLWTSHNDLKLHVAANYVPRNDHTGDRSAADERMSRIERAQQRQYELLLRVAAKLDVRVTGWTEDQG